MRLLGSQLFEAPQGAFGPSHVLALRQLAEEADRRATQAKSRIRRGPRGEVARNIAWRAAADFYEHVTGRLVGRSLGAAEVEGGPFIRYLEAFCEFTFPDRKYSRGSMVAFCRKRDTPCSVRTVFSPTDDLRRSLLKAVVVETTRHFVLEGPEKAERRVHCRRLAGRAGTIYGGRGPRAEPRPGSRRHLRVEVGPAGAAHEMVRPRRVEGRHAFIARLGNAVRTAWLEGAARRQLRGSGTLPGMAARILAPAGQSRRGTERSRPSCRA